MRENSMIINLAWNRTRGSRSRRRAELSNGVDFFLGKRGKEIIPSVEIRRHWQRHSLTEQHG